jgi:hypothetical protein
LKLAHTSFDDVDILETVTDGQGRYRLSGMPKGAGNKILAVPPADLPYVVVHAAVPEAPGLDTVTVDFELKRGVWIEGKITDKHTGKPLHTGVDYFALSINPNLGDYAGFQDAIPRGSSTKEDGSYRVVGLPGPGSVAVYAMDNYLVAPDRDDEDGVKETSLGFEAAPHFLLFPTDYGALSRVDPPKGVESVKRDVALVPSWIFTGTVLGPDGKPLAGAQRLALTGWGEWERDGMKSAEFTVREFNPRRPHDILFRHSEKGLVGVAQPPKENGGAVTVRMAPGVAVTGRLVDAEGQPGAGMELKVRFRLKESPGWAVYTPESIKTDPNGRFRIEALLPGCQFRLSNGKFELPFGDTLRAGQTKDLGDVPMKQARGEKE